MFEAQDESNKITVLIPTYNRPDDLLNCIKSILEQILLPNQIIIVDDGELNEEIQNKLMLMLSAGGIELIYRRKEHTTEPRGLSLSRMIGLSLAYKNVLILDDDIVLEPDCIKWLMQAKNKNADQKTVAIGGVILNNRRKKVLEKVFDRFFLLTSSYSWDVNDWGFQVWDDYIYYRSRGYYAHSGFCLYDRDLALQIGFPDFQGGRPGLEDVYFSLKAKQSGLHYIIEPQAKSNHYHSLGGRLGDYETGFREAQNRKAIFGELCDQSFKNQARYYWANFGWIIRQFFAGHLERGFGMVIGTMQKINKKI